MKVTPHTIFIYAHGRFLRIVRGEHQVPDTTIKPRVYENVVEALRGERREKILRMLKLFPNDKIIDKRLAVIKAPPRAGNHRSLVAAIRSNSFKFAQAGYDNQQKEVSYIYHSDQLHNRGVSMVAKGPTLLVRKLLKKYRKSPLRELSYVEPPSRRIFNPAQERS